LNTSKCDICFGESRAVWSLKWLKFRQPYKRQELRELWEWLLSMLFRQVVVAVVAVFEKTMVPSGIVNDARVGALARRVR